MEWTKLPTIVLGLVLVGLIVGIGVLVLDLFGDTVKDSTTVAYGDENVSLLGGAGTLSNDEVTTFSFLGNVSINYTVGTEVNLSGAEAGTITVSYPAILNGSYFVGYVYDADNAATTTANAGRDAIGEIATAWLALVVTIIVLALILAMVIRGFGRPR